MNISRKYLLSLGERVAATAAAAGLGYVITQLADMSGPWIPVITVGLTVLKGVLAKYVGDPESAGLK